MIYIIIGQAGSGKTTFTKKTLLKGNPKLIKGKIYITKYENAVALGKYGIGIRTEGTDTLAYNAKDKIKETIRALVKDGENVVLEGDRINNKEIFNYISTLGVETRLFLVNCSIKTSMERLRAAGSTITPTFVKATKTKSKRMYLTYRERFNGRIINTD